MDEELKRRTIARRRLLRRAGTVAAGVAGVTAVSSMLPNAAQAAPGGNMILGQANDASTANTSLTANSATNPSLTLTNPAITTVSGLRAAGPQLQLTPNGDYVNGPVGSMGFSDDGTLWTVRAGSTSGTTAPDFVRTGANSTIMQSFAPVRVLDTRTTETAGKLSIMNPSAIDQYGYIRDNTTLNVNLDNLLVWGWTIFANITIIAGGSWGFMVLHPADKPRPANASNITFSPGSLMANFCAVSVGKIAGSNNAISVYAEHGVQVILDVAGAIVNYPSDIKHGAGGVQPLAAGSTDRVRPAELTP